jgi:hypothetical protein
MLPPWDREMSTIEKLIDQRQQLLARLQAGPGPNERAELQALLAKIETALKLLDPQGTSLTSGK